MQRFVFATGRILPTRLRSWLRRRPLVAHVLNRVRNKPLLLQGPLEGCRMCGPEAGAYSSGDYEAATVALIERIVEPGMVCVDCGAHMGYFTLLMAKLVGEGGQVYAFEAYPENADLVRANIELNGFENRANVDNMCVSDGSKAYEALYPGRASSSAEWNIMGHDVDGQETAAQMVVPAKALDDCFPPVCKIDFIKMDIEGAEGKALAGMRRILMECRPSLFIEFHDDEGWKGRNELFASGYELYDAICTQWISASSTHSRVYHCLAVPTEKRAWVEERELPERPSYI